jgi:hypothetical protein
MHIEKGREMEPRPFEVSQHLCKDFSCQLENQWHHSRRQLLQD